MAGMEVTFSKDVRLAMSAELASRRAKSLKMPGHWVDRSHWRRSSAWSALCVFDE
jgi:hypothetical protein